MSARRVTLELDGVIYQLGFDERRDAARFMVSNAGRIVAQGLITTDCFEPALQLDEPERPLDPRIADALLSAWLVMRAGL